MERPYPFLTPKNEALRLRWENSLYLFNKEFLGFDRLVEPLHSELCTFVSGIFTRKQLYSLIEIPRGCFKTTNASVGATPWWILRFPDLRALVASSTNALSEKIYARVKRILEMPETRLFWPDVVWDNPEDQAEEWTSASLTVQREYDDIVPTLQWASVEKGTIGQHFHLIILDDIVDEVNSATAGRREKTKSFFLQLRNQVRRPDPYFPTGGRILDIGTPWHHDDAHSMLTEKGGPFEANVETFIKGIFGTPGVTLGEPAATQDKVIFPEEFCVDREDACWKCGGRDSTDCSGCYGTGGDNRQLIAEVEASMRHHAPAQLYCDPTPESQRQFKKKDINWYEPGKHPPIAELNVYGSFDPNRSNESKADPCALVFAGWDSEGNLWVLSHSGGHPVGPALVSLIVNQTKRYMPAVLWVESNNFQNQLQHWLRPKFLEMGIRSKVSPVVRSHVSKSDRILTMTTTVANGGLWLPNNESGRYIEAELVNFGSARHDDAAEALSDIHNRGKVPRVEEARVMLPQGKRAETALEALTRDDGYRMGGYLLPDPTQRTMWY